MDRERNSRSAVLERLHLTDVTNVYTSWAKPPRDSYQIWSTFPLQGVCASSCKFGSWFTAHRHGGKYAGVFTLQVIHGTDVSTECITLQFLLMGGKPFNAFTINQVIVRSSRQFEV
jgi:hypothetical protein